MQENKRDFFCEQWTHCFANSFMLTSQLHGMTLCPVILGCVFMLLSRLMCRMFENSPSVREAFEKFRELDEDEAAAWMPRDRLASSSVLRTHGMVVMNAIDEIISSLDENSEVVELVLEQGRSHARFGDNLTPDSFWVGILHWHYVLSRSAIERDLPMGGVSVRLYVCRTLVLAQTRVFTVT